MWCSATAAPSGVASYCSTLDEGIFFQRLTDAFPSLIDIICTDNENFAGAVQELRTSLRFLFIAWSMLESDSSRCAWPASPLKRCLVHNP